MIAKEGLKIILLSFIVCFVISIWNIFTDSLFAVIFLLLSLIVFLFVLYFFRDPYRSIPSQTDAILSPADGKVISIRDENDSFVGSAQMISIFMSLFDVHVTRIPFSGTVKDIRYREGSFKAAFNESASEENERNRISLEAEGLKLVFTQVAGLVARRIVSYLKVGDRVTTGERCGMIMFGSRVDLIVPDNVELKVKVGDRVRGGESIIGEVK